MNQESPTSDVRSNESNESFPGGRLLIALGALVALGALGLQSVAEEASASVDATSTGPLPVVTTRIEVLDGFEMRERIAGRIASRRRSELGFERGGRLAEVHVDEGDRVEAGALLARLDTRELEAAKREQEARVDATAARLELARVTAARQRRLEASGTLSPQALDEALTEESSLAAQLAADRAALESANVGLALSRLEAPYPAIVVKRHLDEGSVAMPASPILSIIESGVREVKLGAPSDVAAELDFDRDYVVQNGSVELAARLRRVLPELDPRTRTQTAIFEIDQAEASSARLADGALVWVRVSRSVSARGSWVPIGALAEGRRGTWTLYAVAEDETGVTRVERRVVDIVQTEGERAFVRGTLRDGERIVADGLHRLIPGLAVRVVASPDAS